MSVKVQGWVWDLQLPTSEKIVLLKLADHAHHDGSNVYPSVAEVARDTGLSQRQVQRYLRGFVENGILEIESNADGGRGRTRHYRFTFQMPNPPTKGDTGDAVSGEQKGDANVTLSDPETTTPMSPITEERVTSVTQKGDTGDAKRVTPTVKKGDTHARANQNRQEPSIEPSKNRLPKHGPAQVLVATLCEEIGIDQPTSYGTAVGQAQQLVDAGCTTDEFRAMTRWFLADPFWAKKGIDMGILLKHRDRYRTAIQAQNAKGDNELFPEDGGLEAFRTQQRRGWGEVR